MWGKLKEAFNPSEETLKRECEIDEYGGIDHAPKRLINKFMKTCSDIIPYETTLPLTTREAWPPLIL